MSGFYFGFAVCYSNRYVVYLAVLLTCIPSRLNDVEHLFVRLFAICIASLLDYLPKTFAHIFLLGCLFSYSPYQFDHNFEYREPQTISDSIFKVRLC